MRTFSLYDPKIYSFTFVRGGEVDALVEQVKKTCRSFKDINLDINRRGGWIVIEIMADIQSGERGSVNVSADLIKVRYEAIVKVRKTILDNIKPHCGEHVPHSYTMITSGSHDNVWLRTYSDMSFLYKEKEDRPELLQTNITHLNRIFRRSNEVMVNSIKHSKVDASLYILGPHQGKSVPVFPEDIVLEIDLSDLGSSTYGENPITVTPSTPYDVGNVEDKRSYQQRQNYLISLMAIKSKLTEMFILQSEFQDLRTTEIYEAIERGKELKEQIFNLQNSINEHMKVYIPKAKDKKTKGKDFLDRETFEVEKQLLTTASVRFSMVSEVEHKIMRESSILGDLSASIHDVARALSLESSKISLESVSYSYGDLTLKEVEQEIKKLDILMKELAHSRDILSSNIEVLRTFIDTRQREVSEDMSRLMNLLFLVFACIGLADALGNFVILVLDKGFLGSDSSLYDVISYGALGMMFTLLPLLIAAIFLYLYFKKK
ncbi:MAG: hypothetical protein U9R75_02910 [Candidatus Thermoplasmatota archaeon]|nr:hypothetical protein [Candidatus Thermoplasmatota archaeon]